MQLDLEFVKRLNRFVEGATKAMDESGLEPILMMEGAFLAGWLDYAIKGEEKK